MMFIQFNVPDILNICSPLNLILGKLDVDLGEPGGVGASGAGGTTKDFNDPEQYEDLHSYVLARIVSGWQRRGG